MPLENFEKEDFGHELGTGIFFSFFLCKSYSVRFPDRFIATYANIAEL